MLILVPGWGVDPALLEPFRAALPGPTAVLMPGPVLRQDPGQDPGRFAGATVGIGHSLGGLWLLAQEIPWLERLVLINGFARFTAAPDWPHAEHPRILARMRQRFAADPAATLAAFRERVGAPRGGDDGSALTAADRARLGAGLGVLADADGRERLACFAGRLLCLAAPDDPLVPQELTEATAALAGVQPVWRAGGHLLPITEPRWCADRIAAFLA